LKKWFTLQNTLFYTQTPILSSATNLQNQMGMPRPAFPNIFKTGGFIGGLEAIGLSILKSLLTL